LSTTSKTFELKLEITTENVIVWCPSGCHFSYPRKSLPTVVYNLVRRVLIDDSNLCKHIAETIELEPPLEPPKGIPAEIPAMAYAAYPATKEDEL
jgi:hypothetical protein